MQLDVRCESGKKGLYNTSTVVPGTMDLYVANMESTLSVQLHYWTGHLDRVKRITLQHCSVCLDRGGKQDELEESNTFNVVV